MSTNWKTTSRRRIFLNIKSSLNVPAACRPLPLELPVVFFYKEGGFERTLVITTISSRGRRSSLMAFPKTISDCPLEYIYSKKNVNA
jgi:hypothetical protein